MRLGYACIWEEPPERTWSYTPWSLRRALQERVSVVDLVPDPTRRWRRLLRALHARPHGGTMVSRWRWSRSWQRVSQSSLDRQAARSPVDAVVQIGDIARFEVPSFSYEDLSYQSLLELHEQSGAIPMFHGLDLPLVRRLAERQLGLYEQSAGVFAMSRWLADTLARRTGLSGGRVHVVYAGRNAIEAVDGADDRLDAAGITRLRQDEPPRRLLFIGTDFLRKAGDVVVKATGILHRERDPGIRLTVAGPAEWRLPGPVPPEVDFLGRVSLDQAVDLYCTHDVYVMPARFEPFGIVFAEALSAGLPCVARDAFAMPEFVRDGENGALVRGEDPAEVAEAIGRVLDDRTIFERCWEERAEVRARFSWPAVAGRMLDAVAAQVP